jgi:hypothetical protein
MSEYPASIFVIQGPVNWLLFGLRHSPNIKDILNVHRNPQTGYDSEFLLCQSKLFDEVILDAVLANGVIISLYTTPQILDFFDNVIYRCDFVKCSDSSRRLFAFEEASYDYSSVFPSRIFDSRVRYFQLFFIY